MRISRKKFRTFFAIFVSRPRGEYVPPQKVGFLRRFGLKTGIDFAHFGLELGRSFSLGMMYEGTTIVYQCVRRQAFPNEQERECNMRIRNGF